ncbi:MAG: hypothetical protein COZ70_09755 [Deltaproteobacteria bacterium CG_4_8_14_3_um_filter_51_11]|nr:hypothetical protein [bacterium]OIP43603.1 MAG: hypothetical protein AUK25_01070 [Desulfobacteraceae bacterium CG2_30_51_40]PIP46739.1 MAG: hypothetical protein COX16_08175 [Deltaproteobacteria bacterium CG23_combo_of_CG06-09_8_20_14_all_51_20]PIX19282.1 MAG: hypothetical protein COZ70_09755 [Deltaproteobacteria bacterium CG_4_8_14_3_um_filter_51_11]PIY22431.1 MAG: hypothetical protein COZ11_12655 [Deltaproteobacteria bacterium CG_4_10_14_3_um_filter_51_14]PJB36100.1 MAG: hypothetical prote
MGWNSKSVYEALLKNGNYEKRGANDKYVSLDRQALRSLNSILYRDDSQYWKAPVHINKGRDSFSEAFFRRIEPALDLRSAGSHNWGQYSIRDWDAFAKGLGLDTDLRSQHDKGGLKENALMYTEVRTACIACFQKIGRASEFTRSGNIIGCMKGKMSADWPQDWIDWVVKNAGQIVKGIEIEK